MVRILGILVVGLIALNIGLGAALLKGRFEAVKSIRALEQEIHTRASLSGERHDGFNIHGFQQQCVADGFFLLS